MKDIKMSNMQKESKKIRIKKNINECEDLKAQKLLELGIMVFDKIRRGLILHEEFIPLCEEIKNLDIEIYTQYMQLRSFENERKKTTCQCGYVAFKNEKFCPQCGRNLIQEEIEYIICDNCNEKTEKNSKFCSCCGSKIKEKSSYYEDEVCCVEDKNISESILDEIPNIEMIKEEIIVDEYTEENDEDDINTQESIEIEGKEFLKKYYDNNIEK